jgi:hypothetical protein
MTRRAPPGESRATVARARRRVVRSVALGPVLALVLGLAASLAAHLAAASAHEDFPGFAAYKDSLGVIPLAADVVVIENVPGDVENVYLDECQALGARVLAVFDSALTAKGYHLFPLPLVSIGAELNSFGKFAVFGSSAPRPKTGAAHDIGPPPIYMDSTQCPDRNSQANWISTVRRVAGYRLDEGFPGLFPEATNLEKQGKPRYLLVVVVMGTRVPRKHGLFSGIVHPLVPALSIEDPCNPSVTDGVPIHQPPPTLLKAIVIDTHQGEAAWADGECSGSAYSPKLIERLMHDVLKRLP